MEAGQFCPVYLFMKYYFTVIIILILDQIVKYKIRTTLAVGERINIISGIFEITNISNSGAAWGSFAESTFILAVISAIISVGILMVIGMNEKLQIFTFFGCGRRSWKCSRQSFFRYCHRYVFTFFFFAGV